MPQYVDVFLFVFISADLKYIFEQILIHGLMWGHFNKIEAFFL